MSVSLISGDIFESNADYLINPVNCLGVSGAGLAKEFAKRYPAAQELYEASCRFGIVRPGYPLFAGGIIYFPTKDDWRKPSRIDWIQEGLLAVADELLPGESVAIPALGCGLGGLNWEDVYESVVGIFGDSEIEVELYEPSEWSSGTWPVATKESASV